MPRESLTSGIVGLQNYSYFCYLNSCLQCLLAIEPFRDHFLLSLYKEKFKSTPTLKRVRHTFRLSLAFTSFFSDVWVNNNSTNSGLVISPNSIKEEIYRKFSPVYQHDCHEFFTYIMSTLQDEETPSPDKKKAAAVVQ